MSDRTLPRARAITRGAPSRTRRRPRGSAFAALLAALLIGGCSGGGSPGEPPAPTPTTPSPETADGGDGPDAPPLADLSDDILVPPPAPALRIAADAGTLRFGWDEPPAGTRTLRLLEHDARTGAERALWPSPGARELQRPTSPHGTPWSDLAWRLERCTVEDCVSSPRRDASGLVADTFRTLRPAVVAAGERYGEALALSADGALLAVGMPVAGRVALWFTRADEPARGDAIDVTGTGASPAPHSPSRELALALSGDGDTLAVLTHDAAAGDPPSVGVFERLGEGWFESARFEPFGAGAGAARGSSVGLVLSGDGERLLVTRAGSPAEPGTFALSMHERGRDGGWHRVPGLPEPLAGARRPVAVAASRDLRRVLVASARDGAPPVLTARDEARGWRAGAELILSRLVPDAPIALVGDAAGERVVVGGFEPSGGDDVVPVLWRYRIGPGSDVTAVTEEASIVLGPPAREPREPRLAAAERLDTAVFAWRADGGTALASVVADARGRWRRALALPGPDGASAARAGTSLATDAGAATLALGVPPDTASDGLGHVLLLRATDERADAAPERR